MADVDDDGLLDALAVALRPAGSAAEPSRAELLAFQSVVASGGDAGAPSGLGRSARLRRWAAGLLVGGVVLSGGTAYATNPVAPRPVRSAAFALKLPVEAPDLTDAKDALDDLEEELHEGRRDKVAAAVEDVEEELADLSASARSPLDARAAALLATSRAFLADSLTREGAEEGEADDDSGSGSDSSGSGGADSHERDSSGSGSGSDERDSSGSGDVESGRGDVDDSSGRGSSGTDSGSSGGRSDDDADSSSGSGDDGGVSASSSGD